MKYRQMVIENGKLTWNEYVSLEELNSGVELWRKHKPSDARIGKNGVYSIIRKNGDRMILLNKDRVQA